MSLSAHLIARHLTSTKYWIYDPDTGNFGPSKFVGLNAITISDYEAARRGERIGARFDGHATRLRIERVLGARFLPSPSLAKAFEGWTRKLIPSDGTQRDVLDGVDRSKWLFVSLQSISKQRTWTLDEVALLMKDYFAMLEMELRGKDYSKTAHRERLINRLKNRSGPSIEFKHCNVSAILEELGLQFIHGYKPRSNYQTALADAVDDYLAAHSDMLGRLESSTIAKVTAAEDKIPEDLAIESILEEPPIVDVTGNNQGTTSSKTVPVKIDWAARDAANRDLGESGEAFVADFERRHLKSIGRSDLVVQVEIVSKTQGDGLGYDVLSFTDEGKRKYIEVKTTNGGKLRSFQITSNELYCSEQLKGHYWLYRVFRRPDGRKLFRLSGPLTNSLSLRPTHYRATLSNSAGK